MTVNGLSNGSLVIAGGGRLPEGIIKRFIELAGGPDRSIVVIPTAQEEVDVTKKGHEISAFEEAGVHNITVLHTNDRELADTEDFTAPLRSADAVWFTGGRQWRLADAYLHTEVHRELHALLERGGVIGGSSAGATIQGSYLVRGDTKTNTILMGDHEEGFGFLKNVTIDQHLIRRNRQFDLVQVIAARPELLGIGIDEATAIVVQGETFEVVGNSYVSIYDSNYLNDHNGQFYFLSPGDTFNLETREAQLSYNIQAASL
ncbi:cyanophycinase [Paenibacillus cellulosilyticus]|uniref:Cyanophycinase n=1 Tax=Paenibacillus cellulosilyticus TaxID=375489 RepID=A0A2V2YT99_9BACL|nr:cyanophycinase [Paenibacillus cellulosilyticus]PWV99469.1 cyanophycinase [Paenibacillus cellulosilyticus]QKS44725.1 cyanophycinase [Paenibacillus cellulosilyticus]